MKQLEFDFLSKDSYDINNFIVSENNEEAYNFLIKHKIESQLIFLNGEEKSGKTYLGNIWKQINNAKKIDFSELSKLDINEYITKINLKIENFDYYILDELKFDFNEEKLFYLINTIISNSSSILIISSFNIFKKRINLKDLESRIKLGINLKIGKFLKKVKPLIIIKLLSDKQLSLNFEIIKYLNKKLPNNYKDIYFKIDKLIDYITTNKEKITLKNIKKYI